MVDLITKGGLALLLTFVMPGFVSFQFMRLFAVNIAREARDFILIYVTLSAINVALVGLLFGSSWLSPQTWSDDGQLALPRNWTAYVLVIPALTGSLLGVLIQWELPRRFFDLPLVRRLHIRPVQRVPTAWDWQFGRTSPCFILITLKDGSQFAGYLGSRSYASSHDTERDLFVEDLYVWDDDEEIWVSNNRSLYVAHGEIRAVEFFKENPNGHATE